MAKLKPLVLTILDGWGYSPATEGNAIALAHKPTYDHLLQTYPNTLIHTSGHFVGLPDGQMGNSEVGHLNIGSGRIIRMDISRIDHAITTGVRLALRARTAAAPTGSSLRPASPGHGARRLLH